MRVLIVEKNQELGAIWQRHLLRQAALVTLVSTQADAIDTIRNDAPEIIVLNLLLPGESAFAIADYASYRIPSARVIFVTNTTFFSDGSIFQHIPNACACINSAVPPEDLCAMVEHYASRSRQIAEVAAVKG